MPRPPAGRREKRTGPPVRPGGLGGKGSGRRSPFGGIPGGRGLEGRGFRPWKKKVGPLFSPSLTAGLGAVPQSLTRRSLRELVITETELKLMAAAAMIGERSIPKKGYRTPAATGTPMVL